MFCYVVLYGIFKVLRVMAQKILKMSYQKTNPLRRPRLRNSLKVNETTRHHAELQQNHSVLWNNTSSHQRTGHFSKNSVVYEIDCADCCCSYIGETDRALETRKKENNVILFSFLLITVKIYKLHAKRA